MSELTHGIELVSAEWHAIALARLDTLTKPLGSLGRLEDIAAQWVAIRREQWAAPVGKGVYIFAADHGVTAEGVSAYPSDVTQQMVLNFHGGRCSRECACAVAWRRVDGQLMRVLRVSFHGRARPAASQGRTTAQRTCVRGRSDDAGAAAMQALAVGAEMADLAAKSVGRSLHCHRRDGHWQHDVGECHHLCAYRRRARKSCYGPRNGHCG